MDVAVERCIVPAAMERLSRREPSRTDMISPLDRLRNSMIVVCLMTIKINNIN